MSLQNSRYSAVPANVEAGWTLERLTAPSRLFGANGLRTGPDGRIYVAQVSGSQISAFDLTSGAVDVISPLGGDIIGPDDLAFSARGDIYATEVMEGRVSMRAPDGTTKVLRGELPGANGITVHQDRLFIGQCQIEGRIMELDLAGGAPRILVEGLPLPNAMEVGPDGKLYYPLMGSGEIWRIDPAGGTPERVTGDLVVPVALKFDAQGQIVCPQTGSGDVVRVDPRTGDKTMLATLRPGLDNLTFVDGRLFVSHLTDGEITEIRADGTTRAALAGGMNGPFGVAVGSDGLTYLNDGNVFYALMPDGELRRIGLAFSPGHPGNMRGVAADADRGFVVTTTNGDVARYRPWDGESEVIASGLDQILGVAIGKDGLVAVAEFGTGKVVGISGTATETLASGLDQPVDVAFAADGSCVVSESGAGRIVRITGTGVETVADGLGKPHGIVVVGSTLYAVDAGAQSLVAVDIDRGSWTTIASNLPVGTAPGVEPKLLRAFPPFSGPLRAFAGIAAGSDGTLFISADADGSLIALRPL